MDHRWITQLNSAQADLELAYTKELHVDTTIFLVLPAVFLLHLLELALLTTLVLNRNGSLLLRTLRNYEQRERERETSD